MFEDMKAGMQQGEGDTSTTSRNNAEDTEEHPSIPLSFYLETKGPEGPEGSGPLGCEADNSNSSAKAKPKHMQEHSKKRKKTTRFSNIAKTVRQIQTSARKAAKRKDIAARRAEGRGNVMRIGNLLNIDDIVPGTPETVQQGSAGKGVVVKEEPVGSTGRKAESRNEATYLSRRQTHLALLHLSEMLRLPMIDIKQNLPSPIIYAHQPAQMPEHPVLAKLDLLMYNWQNQGAEGTVERVGLELACAWVLAREMKEDTSSPSEIEQRLIAALDRLANE